MTLAILLIIYIIIVTATCVLLINYLSLIFLKSVWVGVLPYLQ